VPEEKSAVTLLALRVESAPDQMRKERFVALRLAAETA
jgi:hypothetical protein